MVERAAGAGGDHPALDPGDGQHRPTALLLREQRCRLRRRCHVRLAGAAGPGGAEGPRAGPRVRRHRPAGVPRGRHPLAACTRRSTWVPSRAGGASSTPSATTAAFVADVAAAYIEGFQLRRELGPDLGGHDGQALPRRRPAARRRGPALPVRAEQVYPGGRFEDHLVPFRRAIEVGTLGADALLRHADRPGAGRGADRGGRVRLQQADPHRACCASSSATRA